VTRLRSLTDYPNAAGILLAWRVATEHNSRQPIAELATELTREPWQLHYSDATKVVAAALKPHNGKGEPV
jgi:hypothetical protein